MSRFLTNVRKGLVGLGITLSVLCAVLPAKSVYAATDAEITSQIDDVKSRINGKYWNKGKSGNGKAILFEVTSNPCKGNTVKGGTCTSNAYEGGSWQCIGFAKALSEYLFGSNYLKWSSDTALSYVRPGDVISTSGHAAVVWKVESNGTVKVAECWGGKTEEYHKNNCKIAFGLYNGDSASTLKEINKLYKISAIYRHPGSTASSSASSSATSNATTPTISLSSEKSPSGILKQGSNFGLRGIFTTNVGSISINGGVYYTNGTPVSGFTKSYSVSGRSINIQNTLNNYVIFNKLPAGDYKYIVTATAKNGSKSATKTISSNFTVQGKDTTVTPSITVSSVKAPTGTLTQGKNFGLRGIVSTNVGNIAITGGVYYTNGTPVNGFTKNYVVSGKTINIQNTLNNYVIFDRLPEGNYIYRVTATAVNGSKSATKDVAYTSFTVKGNSSRTVSSVSAPAPAVVKATVEPQPAAQSAAQPQANTNAESSVSKADPVVEEVVYEEEEEVTNEEPAVEVVEVVETPAAPSAPVISQPVVDNTPAPSIGISGQNYPSSTHKRGKNFGIRGIVNTNCGTLTSVRGYVYDSNNRIVPGFASEYNSIGSSSFDLRYSINNDLIFNNLACGEYRYVVTASAANGSKTSEVTLIDYSFSVR